jgi:hypothetical protein
MVADIWDTYLREDVAEQTVLSARSRTGGVARHISRTWGYDFDLSAYFITNECTGYGQQTSMHIFQKVAITGLLPVPGTRAFEIYIYRMPTKPQYANQGRTQRVVHMVHGTP